MKVPQNIEINTINYLTLISEYKKTEKRLKNDLYIYSITLSDILKLQMFEFGGKQYVDINEILKICNENFKRLSKNRKD